MRSVLVVMLLAVSAFAQEEPSAVAPACGPKGAWLDVKLDESQHALAKPEPGKARIYFVQDAGEVSSCDLGFSGRGCSLTSKIGLDGEWVGANRHNSYFSVSVEPGEHHVCASWQSHNALVNRQVAFAHLSAEAGKVYYFRTRPFGNPAGDFDAELDIDPLDSDQAKHLIDVYPLSFSHPKR